MLGKLLKHEMKACARLLLPLYITLIFLSIADRIFLSLNIFKGSLKIIPGFITFLYIVAIFATIVVSVVIIIYRFHKNLTTDEGYLMFTLPVKTHQLINSKLIASIFWSVVSTIAVLGSIFMVVVSNDRMELIREGIHDYMEVINEEFGNLAVLFNIEMILMIIFALLYGILLIYASIAAGQLFNGHKIIGSFAAYIALNTVTQIIGTILIYIINLIFNNNFGEAESLIKLILPMMLIFLFFFSALYYIAANYLFKRKLNLE